MLKWTGRATVAGISVSVVAMIFTLGITGPFAMIFLVMTSGPSKLRNEMLRILVYEFIGLYVLVTPVCLFFLQEKSR